MLNFYVNIRANVYARIKCHLSFEANKKKNARSQPFVDKDDGRFAFLHANSRYIYLNTLGDKKCKDARDFFLGGPFV